MVFYDLLHPWPFDIFYEMANGRYTRIVMKQFSNVITCVIIVKQITFYEVKMVKAEKKVLNATT